MYVFVFACLWVVLWGHVTTSSVTIFLHRTQAHKALILRPIASHFFRFWLWLTTGMVTKEWVAVHRKHHAYCETKDDPHSPQVKGLISIFPFGVWSYIKEARQKATLEKYGADAPSDWLERYVYSTLVGRFIGVSAMFTIDVLVFGLGVGSAVWLTQILWIPFFGAAVINGLGHYVGYRNFETPDASRNLPRFLAYVWIVVTGGEEFHNNHHDKPTSACFSFKPSEFDINWSYIRFLESRGWCTVKRRSVRASA